MRIEWSAFAMEDRDGIFDYIEGDSPNAAVAVDERISMQVMALMPFPQSGRPGRIEDTRELVISGTAYIAVYRITGETIRVLRVLHSAQIWPDEVRG